MIKKIVMICTILLFFSSNVYAKDFSYIEIFNISQGQVINKVPSNSFIQDTVKDYLNGITGIYAKFNPIPNKGHAIKIPLKPSLKIKNKWMDSYVNEVVIIFPESESNSEESSPFLIVFEHDTRLLCFTFKGNTNKLLKNLNLKLTPSQ